MFHKILLWTVLSFSASVLALPNVEVERVNGFEVHYVDIGQGDSYGVTFAVPFGTMHDTNSMMGRAHLLEHVMHIGSKKFPGYHAFDEKLSKVGVYSNAYTAGHMTFYFSSGTENHGELISQVMFAMLGGLEWNESYYSSERDVVINEIAVESNKKDAQVSRLMAFTKLLPADHPWNHAILGDAQSLKKMSLNDVKEFYYRVYNPQHVKVAVLGNFSKPELKAKAKKWTHQYLQPAKIQEDPHGYVLGTSPAPIELVPSEFSKVGQAPESEKVLYLESKVIKSRELLLSVDRSQLDKPQGVILLTDYLSLNVPGTWLYHLQSELGWITGASLYPTLYKNRIQIEVGFSLTDLGAQHRQEVTDLLFKALKSVQSGVPEDVLTLIKENRLLNLAKDGRSVRSYMSTYGDSLSESSSQSDQLKEYTSVSSEDLAQIAAAFKPGQALYVDVGPEIQDMEFDSNFERHFKLVDHRADLIKYNKSVTETPTDSYLPQLREVNLTPFKEVKKPVFVQTQSKDYLANRTALDLRTDLSDSAASVRLRLAPQNKIDVLAATLFWQSFFEEHSSELAYLRLKYQSTFSLDLESDMLVLKSLSEGRNAGPALEWLLQEVSRFVPTRNVLERNRETLIESSQGQFASNFTAVLGIAEARANFDPLYLSDASTVIEAKKLDLDTVVSTWKRLAAQSDKQFVLVGNFAGSEIQRIKDAVKLISPQNLSAEQTQRLNSRFKPILSREELRMAFPLPSASKSSFAQIRSYQGPSVLDIKESAALLALNALTSELVGSYNRGDQALGYMHGTHSRVLDGQHHFLSFLGGVDGVENTKLVVAGWEYVLKNLNDGVYSDEKIGDAIESVRNSLLEQKNSADELLLEYSQGLNIRRNAIASKLLIEALESMTPEDVMKLAHKYILGADKNYVQYTFGDCAQFLN